MCCSPRGRKESDATERLSSTKDKARQGVPAGSVVENPPASAGDSGSTPGSGRSPGERNDSLLQYSCLGSPMDKVAWWVAAHRVAKSRTQLSN